MKKFAFIGAGSVQFTASCVRDILTFPAFRDAHFALMDIDPAALENIKPVVEKILQIMDAGDATVSYTTDRKEALRDADGVLCTVLNGGLSVWKHDILIPKKYGVDINIGDTRSVSGIFRALRNIPLLLDICHDIEKYCPRAVFLNYTNPMAMICGAMQKYTNVEITGLCHSVQHTVSMLADWLCVPYEEISYHCMGVNHQAFYTHLSYRGEDLYPRLYKLMEDPAYFNKEQVRNEMFLKLGYYVTESSGHNSEYNAWFRKRPDLIEKYCTHSTEWNPGHFAYSITMREEQESELAQVYRSLEEGISTEKSVEYAADIFNARFGDGKPFIFNGNVLNHGSIPNLPYDACVEVPVVADRMGMKTTIAGPLPDHIAILVNTTARIESLVIEAAMKKSKQMVYRAVYMDPLCSAVCSLEEIKAMCDELFEVNKEYLGDYI